jgi:hypothetical protein
MRRRQILGFRLLLLIQDRNLKSAFFAVLPRILRMKIPHLDTYNSEHNQLLFNYKFMLAFMSISTKLDNLSFFHINLKMSSFTIVIQGINFFLEI